jgi:FAD/FMN-containing dehydrogenase
VTRAAATSWSRWPRSRDQEILRLYDRHAALPRLQAPYIAYGNGRSYSDVCQNEGGILLDTRGLDKFIHFDRDRGRLCCEAGILLQDILDLVVPHGWFLAVTPGTRYVTLGGAIANDVHGKNHHVAGSFGQHVTRLGLRRSDGSLLVCGPDQESAWFAATVGGLGLTGVIIWAEIQLVAVESEAVLIETRSFEDLEGFWEVNAEGSAAWPYTVAWIDCMARRGRRAGRGVLLCGRHAPRDAGRVKPPRGALRIGLDPPFSLVRSWTARPFNALYYRKGRGRQSRLGHFRPFFYPLDGVHDWNRLYGRKGFFQYQCVLPMPGASDVLAAMLGRIAASRETAFLGVLKSFGDDRPVGLLSFPRPGVTLAVDFPNGGTSTLRLLADLDAIVLSAGGALYPAKDSRMPAEVFRAGYPRLEEFMRFVDPGASSGFWRRVTA